MAKEKWRDIPNVPYYQASSNGRIRSLNRTIEIKFSKKKKKKFFRFFPGVILKFDKKINGAGYYGFWAYGDQAVHRCVYSAFFGRIPKNKSVNHKNCNKLDNKISNLEIVSFSYQVAHALKNGRMDQHRIMTSLRCSGSKNPRSKLTATQAKTIVDRLNSGESGPALAREYGVTHASVYYCRKTKWYLKELNLSVPNAAAI